MWGCAGETIPASDSEDEGGLRREGTLVEGAHREREAWVLRRAAAELGTGPLVVGTLARRMGASSGAGSYPSPDVVQCRAARLAGKPIQHLF